MSSHCFIKNGYHYFLVSKDDGYYWLYSDADFALQYLRANETNKVITSITKGETILLTLGQKFGDMIVTEIQRIQDKTSMFKVKLEKI